MRKYQTKSAAIKAAQKMGSTATTFAGAARYIVARTESLFSSKISYRERFLRSKQTRAEYYQRRHERRLCARYVGLKRLPRYLSEADRQTIANHPATVEYARLAALPVFARWLYIYENSSLWSIRRYAGFLREAKKNSGTLNEWGSIAADAYAHCDFGRKRKTHPGRSCLYPGVRTESYERGRNPWGGKWTHNDYYADYTLIAPAPSTRGRYYKMYYVRPSGEQLMVAASPCFLRIGAGPVERRKKDLKPITLLPVHTQRRILSIATPSALRIGFDRDEDRLMLVDGYGEQYHLPNINDTTIAQEQVREAVNAFRKRRAERISITSPETVWVSVEDSYASGNCRTMTDKFAADFLAAIGADGPVCARADAILAIRDDSFTRRAISYAAARAA